MADLQIENKRLAGLLAEAEVAADEAAQLRDSLEAKDEAQALQVRCRCPRSCSRGAYARAHS